MLFVETGCDHFRSNLRCTLCHLPRKKGKLILVGYREYERIIGDIYIIIKDRAIILCIFVVIK